MCSRKDNVNLLYTRCTELREQVLRIDVAVEKIKDISINASILASQTGSQMRVFSELASQIEKTSRKMKSELSDLLGNIGESTKFALSAVVVTKRVDKLCLAISGVDRKANRVIIGEAIRKNQEVIQAAVSRVSRIARSFDRILRRFEDLLNRLFLALTSIRVEADLFSDHSGEQNISPLADSLEELLALITKEYESFRGFTWVFKSTAQSATARGA